MGIYILGCVFAFIIGIIHNATFLKRITVGDLLGIIISSFFSWITFIIRLYILLADSKFWDILIWVKPKTED